MAGSDERLERRTSLLLSWGLLAVVQAGTGVMVMRPNKPISALTMIAAYVVGHMLALGLLTYALVSLWERWLRRAGRGRVVWARALLGIAAWFAHWLLLRDDLSGPATRAASVMPVWLSSALMSAVAAGGVITAALLGKRLARGWWRLPGIALSCAGAVLNAASFPGSYPGVHLVVALSCAVLLGSALEGVQLPRKFLGASPWLRSGALALSTLGAALSLFVWPRNEIVVALSVQPAAVAMPYLASLRGSPRASRVIPPEQREWFVDRSDYAPVPAGPPLLPPKALVILTSIDGLRADVLENEAHRDALPNLFRLRDESTLFTQARSAGSSTAPSLSALFASRYYSQLYWVEHPKRRGEVFPHLDESPRFPELLAAAGVTTMTVDAAGWLLNDFGIVRGFTDEQSKRVRGYPSAKAVMAPILQRLRETPSEPLFAFAHFLDSHFPYARGGRQSSPFNAYIASIGFIDAQLGELREVLETTGLIERTCWIVMSDHGEAFGEHGMKFHASSLYDELLLVPIMIRMPEPQSRRVEEPVSLVDLGPTILDLLGVATPGSYMGQSLVPFLRGQAPELYRPIVAEARLKRSMVFRDGYKIIYDTRNHGIEIFDLESDPNELHNLYNAEDPSSQRRFDILTTFFAQQALKRPGYEVPYRKW